MRHADLGVGLVLLPNKLPLAAFPLPAQGTE
jgi:hypothetical protein